MKYYGIAKKDLCMKRYYVRKYSLAWWAIEMAKVIVTIAVLFLLSLEWNF